MRFSSVFRLTQDRLQINVKSRQDCSTLCVARPAFALPRVPYALLRSVCGRLFRPAQALSLYLSGPYDMPSPCADASFARRALTCGSTGKALISVHLREEVMSTSAEFLADICARAWRATARVAFLPHLRLPDGSIWNAKAYFGVFTLQCRKNTPQVTFLTRLGDYETSCTVIMNL